MQSLLRQADDLVARIGSGGSRRDVRLAKTGPSGGYPTDPADTFPFEFVDLTFTATAGSQAITETARGSTDAVRNLNGTFIPLDTLIWIVWDNKKKRWFTNHFFEEQEYIHLTLDSGQSVSTTTDTIEFDVTSKSRDPSSTFSLSSFELTINRKGLYLSQPNTEWSTGSGTTSVLTFLEDDTGGGFAEFISSQVQHEANPNDFGFLTQPMVIEVASANVYRMRVLLAGSAGRNATLTGAGIATREGTYWIVTRLGD